VDGKVGELAGSAPGRSQAPFRHEDQLSGPQGEFFAVYDDCAGSRDAHEDDVQLVVSVDPDPFSHLEAHQVGVEVFAPLLGP
jgi:hypothetical protein